MEKQTIQNALISVFDKQGIDELVTVLHESKITIYSTGGTFEYIKSLGIPAIKIETLTGYPEMLEGRVKTLHPAVFAGILAKRTPDHLSQIAELAQSVAGVEDTEKIFIRKNGMNFLVDLHLEVDGEMSVRDSHIIAHLLEEKLINYDLKIIYVALHVEPHDNVIRKPQYLK